MLSYRKLAMRVLGRPLHTEGIDSPRPASQRAAAFILTAAMLTTLAAPAFADIWRIEDGDITVKAGETKGTNKVSQGTTIDKVDTNTIITGTSDTNTVTIDTSKGNVDVTFDDLNIDASSRNEAAMSVTGSGNTTIKLDGDNHLTGGNGDTYGGDGIASTGSLTISGGETDSLTAQGGSGENGGDGITSSGSLTISGGTVTATGGNSTGIVGSGGSGIHSGGDVTISGGTVTATGGDSTGSDGSGGYGIYSSSTTTISGGTVTATGGDSTGSYSSGGYGIYSSGVTISGGSTVTANGGSGKDGSGDGIFSFDPVAISGGTVTAKGGSGEDGEDGGDGIRSFDPVAISGGTVTAKGGSGEDGSGGRGIISTKSVTISGGTVNANGGSGKNGNGGNGIIGSGRVAISGGTVEAAGGNGGKVGGSVIDLSGSLELTAKAGSPNGKALSQRGKELDLNTIKDKLGPGAKVTTTDADGKVIDQVPIPRPVEPEESSSSSDGGSSAPSASVSSLPGLTVTDKSGAVISYTSTQSGNTLTVCVGRFTASFRISLAALRQLRAEGIETIAFQTILCSTTLSVDELLAMGGEDAEAVLTHRFTDSSLTVG
ncbi:carbohydrate-binding domain-containing protein [Faecalibacterium sp. Marseille-P9312]|uniref:carbohydrate-binding domain-containing protein n=1 Tax=Faecalibacterium sp. Marseille-P9312 TaxID=2580425 RepID=UPI001FA99E1C|nr:carbohydrate-binding domain-containing protein [Faecalibacterium sp. Marseille-P9312]